MILIFRRYHDECGDGVRADLTRYEELSEADQQFDRFTDDDSVFEVEMFIGSSARIWTRSADEPKLPTSGEILSVSPLEDVDDLENKENV